MHPVMRCLGIAAIAAIAGCTQPTPQAQWDYVTLPPDAVVGAGDPARAAILNAAYVFGAPGSVAGQPVEAARAVANLEYVASEIPTGPRWREFDPTLKGALRQARQEERAALGISQDVPPQLVIDAMFATSRALRAGDTAAAGRILSPPAFPNGAETLQRLANLPPMPVAAQVTSRTALELDRVGRLGGRGGGGDTGSSGGRR